MVTGKNMSFIIVMLIDRITSSIRKESVESFTSKNVVKRQEKKDEDNDDDIP
jgi:hypothetical protein